MSTSSLVPAAAATPASHPEADSTSSPGEEGESASGVHSTGATDLDQLIGGATGQPPGTGVVVDNSTSDAHAESVPMRVSHDREPLRTPPPSYSGPPAQPLFLPYVTQELPCYSDNPGEWDLPRRVGFLHQSEAHFTPIQIPGYITTDEFRQPPTLQARNTVHTHIQRTRPAPASPPVAAPAPAPPKDYLTITFTLLLCCILHLNLPAVLVSLAALGFSIKTRELNARRMYQESDKYSRLVLICDSVAVLEYAVIVVTAATVLVLIFIFDFQLFQSS